MFDVSTCGLIVILDLLVVVENMSSDTKCYAPVVCSNGTTNLDWQQVFPPIACETNHEHFKGDGKKIDCNDAPGSYKEWICGSESIKSLTAKVHEMQELLIIERKRTNALEIEILRMKTETDGTELKRGCPQTKYVFPRQSQKTDFIRLKGPVQNMTELTICLWVSPPVGATVINAIFSYAIPEDHNAILLFFEDVQMKFFIKNPRMHPTLIESRTHLCFSIGTKSHNVGLYINGSREATLNFPDMDTILGGGSFVLGQDQDITLGGYDASQAFSGIIENLMMWYRILGDQEILDMEEDGCSCPEDYDIAFTTDLVQMSGSVRALPTTQC